MADRHRRTDKELVQQILLDDPEFLRWIVERALQQVLEAEITERVGAAPYERTESRKGYRNGYKPRRLKTRVGTLELLVPQDTGRAHSQPTSSSRQRDETTRHAAAAGTAVASLQPVLAQSVPGLKRTEPVLSKNVNTARRLLVTRPPRQRPRRIMPVLSHHYVHWHVVFVYGNLLHHLALECTGDQPRARR